MLLDSIVILLVALGARLVSALVNWLPDVVVALALGVAIRNLIHKRPQVAAGFTVHYVLRLAIVLLGSSLALGEALKLGSQTLGLIVGLVFIAMALGFILARLFNLNNSVGTLIGAGTAICGASAIVVMSPLVKAKSEETAYALTTIFAFNLIALLVYPWFGHQLHLSPVAFGTWAGTAVNDTSVVVATGYVFGATAGVVATVVKLTRTTMIVPLAVLVGLLQPGPKERDFASRISRSIPWFVFGFLAMSLARTFGEIPPQLLGAMAQIASFLIACVLAAVGLNTDLRSMVRLGSRPLIVGFLLASTMGLISFAAIQALRLG